MAAFADIFAESESTETPMAAPGLPLGALSGNPAATVTNLAAIGGAQMGSAFGQPLAAVIGQAIGSPSVDPAAMRAQRQEQFYDDIRRGVADGMSYGEAMGNALKSGNLSPEERAIGMEVSQKYLREEQETARKLSSDLYKSDFYKEYVTGKNNWLAMLELARKPSKSVNDFTLLQRFLKTVDPDSATLQGEIDALKLSATGMQSLRNVFGDSEVTNIMAGLLRFQAGEGNQLTLNSSQKRALLVAAGEVIKAKQKTAIAGYDQFVSQFLGTGGSQQMLKHTAAAALKQIDWSYESAMLEGPGLSSGTMPNNWLHLTNMADEKRERVNQAISNVAVDAVKFSGMFAVDFATSGVLALRDAWTQWRDEKFSPDADPAEAAGAAMAIDPNGTATDLDNTWKMGTNTLNMVMDILTGGSTSKMSGTTAVSPLVEQLTEPPSTKGSRRRRRNKPKMTTEGSF